MERPATWKVITVGAALTGLGIVGAATASAATTPTAIAAPISVEAPLVPGDFVTLGDDWTETYWDDNWGNPHWVGDWTETYWDD